MVEKESKNFIDLVSNFDPKNTDQKKELENIIFEFPYFQLAHAIYLKSLKVQDKFNYDLVLKKTAILSSKRKLIFSWTESDENSLFQFQKISKQKDLEESEIQNSQSLLIEEKNKLNQLDDEMHFVDWIMSYSNYSEKNEKNPLDSKIEIINSFLEKNPKIPTKTEKEKDSITNLASKDLFKKSELMTETLAKIYVKQKKNKKALYAYKILSLKYPEKSSFFANQIKKIQKKQNKKT